MTTPQEKLTFVELSNAIGVLQGALDTITRESVEVETLSLAKDMKEKLGRKLNAVRLDTIEALAGAVVAVKVYLGVDGKPTGKPTS